MNTVGSWIPIASTFSVLAPLFLLSRNFRSYNFEIKALAFYLAIGFFFDLATWYFYSVNNNSVHHGLNNTYDLFEAVFLYWFLGRVSPYPRTKILFKQAWIVLAPFWLMRFYSPEWMGWFKTFTQVLIAFVSCFFILRLVEKTEDISHNLVVWILLGIFFYCFCTYFILGTLVLASVDTWYSHNLINITTNLIFCIGAIRSNQATF